MALTRAHRCEDLLLLRKFRVTVTVVAKGLVHDHSIRCELGLQIADSHPVTAEEWMQLLFDWWFSQLRSTEYMKRGSVNQDNVKRGIKDLDYVKKLYDIALVVDSERNGVDRSADCIIIIDTINVSTASQWYSNKSVIDEKGNRYAVCTMELTTKLSDARVNELIAFTRSTLYVNDWHAPELRAGVPNDQLCQIRHQCVVPPVNIVYYVCAS